MYITQCGNLLFEIETIEFLSFSLPLAEYNSRWAKLNQLELNTFIYDNKSFQLLHN